MSGDRVWRMPLLHHYGRIMKEASPLADLNNTAGRPGGACNAAAFLKVRSTQQPYHSLSYSLTGAGSREAVSSAK